MKYIYHHLGLGDHIICNGLVRSLIKKDENYTMFVKKHNKSTVAFMYKDLENLSFIEGDDFFVRDFINEQKISNTDVITAGFYSHPSAKDFAESFYYQNNIDPINRWECFYVERDLFSEKEIFQRFGVEENEYVFIHDDFSRGFEVDEDYIINKHLPIIRPQLGLTDNVFDYCYLMQNSLESHFIDSSFRLIFDCLKLRNENIFYHIKMKNGRKRNNNGYHDARTNTLNFKIIE